jgi:hypothetical protein
MEYTMCEIMVHHVKYRSAKNDPSRWQAPCDTGVDIRTLCMIWYVRMVCRK